MYNRKALAIMNRQKASLVNKDKLGHHWVNRGSPVAPFICKRCRALSGTSKAFLKCTNDNAAELVKKTEVWA